MSQLFDGAFLQKIRQLSLNARFFLDGTTAGNRKSHSKGSSVEFSDYREYTPGDDFRRIDWNAYGRFEKLFIKLFMEEREAPVTIFLDVSRSMDWGEPNKTISSRRLAAALAYISLANFDRVTLCCVDDRTQQMYRNLRGKNFFHKVTGILENIQYTGSSNLHGAIEDSRIQWGRGITVLISDLFTQGNIDELLKYLTYHKQTVYLCHILSPQELKPDISDSMRLVDSETGEAMDVTATPSLLKSYDRALSDFISRIRKSCIKWGAYFFQFSSEAALEEMVKDVAEH